MWPREPALWIGAISALIALAVGFGLPITPQQVGLIMAAVSAVLAFVTRSQVSPAADVQTALDMPSGSTQADLKKEIEKQN